MIRKAAIGDGPRLVEMVGHFIQGTAYRDVLRFRPHVVADLVERVLQVGIIFVAEQDGTIVGMIAGIPMEELIAKTPMLDEMVWFVEPEYRNGTIGPRLLRQLETWAKQKNLAIVKMVAPAGTDVGQFYRRLGYTEVESSWVKKLR